MFERLAPLFPYLRRSWKQLLWGFVSIVIYNSLRATLPIVIGRAVDSLRGGVTEHAILVHALRLVAVATASGIFLFINRQLIIGASREIEFALRNDMFANLERQSASFYQTHRTGDIMARTTNDLNAVRQLLGPAILYSANTVFFTAFALPFILRLSPRLTLFAVVPLPIASVLIQAFGTRIHKRFERIQAMFSDISAKAQENFSGARLIRAFAQEQAEIATFETSNLEYISRSLHLVRLMAMLWPTLEFVLGLSLVITLFVGGRQVIHHQLSVGQFTEFMVYMVQLTFPMIALGYVVNLFQRGTASIKRIDELLKEQATIVDADTIPDQPVMVRGEIEFRNLTFAYPNSPTILHDINLRIPAGSSLAIVGPTGSGKSTLINLIPRLYDADPGAVLLDGKPLRAFLLDTLRENIGMVPQETFLFSDTIALNVSFGASDATTQQIEDAASVAHIRTEILEFPKGFQTFVGERGVTLSGGQKQRTAIARAVIRNPRILILDDSLASVDTFTEEQILAGLRTVMQDRTTILISHRTSTARHADRIAVLVEGRITELGTHEDLLARNGYYTRLYEKQQLEEELSVAQ